MEAKSPEGDLNGVASSGARLKEVAQVFLKLGITGFGGPAAHIAMMEKELVRKRQWLTAEHFMDLMGATNLIPGPNSTEMAMHCGHQRAGAAGLWVAGICFIFPAALITGIIAYFYSLYGQLPAVAPIFRGIQPVIFVIVLEALWVFGRKSIQHIGLGLIAALVVAGTLLGLNELILLVGAGLLAVGWGIGRRNKMAAVGTWQIFLLFFKTGSILFGSGYVLFAYLDDSLVKELGWLPRQQLVDAIAVGQFTPGPVLASCTFIGFQLHGFWGGVAATLGVFLPAFLFVQLLNPLVKLMRKSANTGFFMDGINSACVALLAVVTFHIGKSALVDYKTLLLGLVAGLFVFFFKKVNSAWLILAGALVGWLLL